MFKDYTLGLYEKAMPNSLTITEKLRTTARFDYGFMEISIDETAEKLARLDGKIHRSEIANAIKEAGVPIRTMCLSGGRKFPLGSADEQIRRAGLELTTKAIDLACDLGIRIIQLAGYDVYYEASTWDSKKYFAENLETAVHYAAKNGVILAFETMETDFMNTVSKAMKYVTEINSPYLEVYPDIGNITNAFDGNISRITADFASGAGNITSVHLKDTKPNIFRDLNFGEGRVDFTACIKQLLGMGVRMFATEFWCKPESWERDIETNKRFIDEIFSGVIADE